MPDDLLGSPENPQSQRLSDEVVPADGPAAVPAVPLFPPPAGDGEGAALLGVQVQLLHQQLEEKSERIRELEQEVAELKAGKAGLEERVREREREVAELKAQKEGVKDHAVHFMALTQRMAKEEGAELRARVEELEREREILLGEEAFGLLEDAQQRMEYAERRLEESERRAETAGRELAAASDELHRVRTERQKLDQELRDQAARHEVALRGARAQMDLLGSTVQTLSGALGSRGGTAGAGDRKRSFLLASAPALLIPGGLLLLAPLAEASIKGEDLGYAGIVAAAAAVFLLFVGMLVLYFFAPGGDDHGRTD